MMTMVTALRQRRQLQDKGGGSMVAVVAKTQQQGLNKDGGGFTTMAATPR